MSRYRVRHRPIAGQEAKRPVGDASGRFKAHAPVDVRVVGESHLGVLTTAEYFKVRGTWYAQAAITHPLFPGRNFARNLSAVGGTKREAHAALRRRVRARGCFGVYRHMRHEVGAAVFAACGYPPAV